MADTLSAYRGCLLGLAVGDALGCAVDEKTWDEIRADYGPNGLLGYDLVNDRADVSSYTQIASYVGNGLLISLSRRRAEPLTGAVLGLREWARSQQFYRDPKKSFCWVAKIPALRQHHNRDMRMLDALRNQSLGTMEAPLNQSSTPGSLTSAVAVGMFYNPARMDASQVGALAAQTMALSHGDPQTFLSGAVLAYAIAGILQEPDCPLETQFSHAIDAVYAQFHDRFPQPAALLAGQLKRILGMGKTGRMGMERLQCQTCAQVLGGAMYACLSSPEDFDGAMILAVNHSGLSAAVGAVSGAILGAKLGDEALPEFYLESLAPAAELGELAEDLAAGGTRRSLFDDDWDLKYIQGLPKGMR